MLILMRELLMRLDCQCHRRCRRHRQRKSLVQQRLDLVERSPRRGVSGLDRQWQRRCSALGPGFELVRAAIG